MHVYFPLTHGNSSRLLRTVTLGNRHLRAVMLGNAWLRAVFSRTAIRLTTLQEVTLPNLQVLTRSIGLIAFDGQKICDIPMDTDECGVKNTNTTLYPIA